MSGEKHDPLAAARAALTDWWTDAAQAEIDAVVPKAVEYGSQDLTEIGHTMLSVAGLSPVSDEEATEIGIYFYIVGKLARWTSAVREGRRVSDDTLLDLGIYVKMAQRNRAVGGWPFALEKEEEK